MGNDGGSIPTRRELVKEAARALTTTQIKESQAERQEYDWAHDPITRKPLSKPVVSDSSGKLYNKDTILEYLLPSEDDDDTKKQEAEKVLEGRVKSLKDVVEVKFEVEESAEKRRNGGTGRTEKWICPITGKEMGPQAKAVYLVPCGHAFAGSVIKELVDRICPQCNEPYAENDFISILPIAPTDVARLSLREKTLKEKGLTHSLKKASGGKKRKKHAEKEAVNGSATEHASTARTKRTSPAEDHKDDKSANAKVASAAINGINNASTASLTARVLAEEEARNKRRKMMQNENVKSLFSSRDNKPNAANSADFMTRGFSVPAGTKK